jgi:MYXO-CTERM domain-containing protein
MRRTIAVVSATGALLFGGAGVANATVESALTPPSTTATLADNTTSTNNDQHSDKSGLWGLLGLLGLGGLAGLRRRTSPDVGAHVTPTANPGRGV